MNCSKIFFIACSAVLLSGCSPSKPPVEIAVRVEEPKKEVKQERKATLQEYEATLRPSDFDHEVDVVITKHNTEQEEQNNAFVLPSDSVEIQEEIVQGFRIQIFSTSSIDEAAALRMSAGDKFLSDSVYIVFDAPVYKVRVGDFANRLTASQRLPEFIEKGFRDAWIVPDRVVIRKQVFVPLPPK